MKRSLSGAAVWACTAGLLLLLQGCLSTPASGGQSSSQPAQFATAAAAQPAAPVPLLDELSMDQVMNQVAAAVHYPFTAKLLGQQGQPVVRLELDQQGNLLDTQLATRSGSEAINTEALDVFKRIGSFHLNLPPGAYRGLVIIRFTLKHESQRSRFAPANEPEASVQPLTLSLNREDRAALLAAIGDRWRRPAEAPSQYHLVLNLRLDRFGALRDTDLLLRSGNPALDASLLEAAAGATLPPTEHPPAQPYTIQICFAQPDSACTSDESQRQFGNLVEVTAYVSDSTAIGSASGNSATGAETAPSYFERVQQIVSSNVQYPREAQRHADQGVVIVRVRFLRDGTITGVEVLRPASSEALNAEARNVFSRIARFPPVPDGTRPDISSFVMQLPITFALH